MDNILDEIKTHLAKYPRVPARGNKDSLSIAPKDENGFEVSFMIDGAYYRVACGGSHQLFEKKQRREAIGFFMEALTKNCRLKVESRGRFPYRWTLEINHDGSWLGVECTGLIFFPFWLKRNERYLQNDWLPFPVQPFF